VRIFAEPRVTAERRDDGTIVLRSADELGPYAPSIAHLFRDGAAAHPERTLAAQRDDAGWTALTWGDARARADAIAEGLLARGLGPDRPLLILSGNSLEHLSLMLGAYTAGVPVVPLSTAYSLLSRDHERIREVVELCAPGLVFADDHEAFGPALGAAAEGGAAIASLDELLASTPGARVEEAFAAIGPDTVAKILLTSGSTGPPKGVVNTHRMLCSNQRALGQVWPFLADEPPVLVDWLPWSHTFGGNHNLHQVLAHGGTIHIDDGKPLPQLFERTVQALREVSPTVYYNVPAGWTLLVDALERDADLAAAFFSRLRFMFYAAAALPESVWERLRAIAARVAGRPVPLTASWGTTETAPAATAAHFDPSPCGCIGVPLPGTTLKLAPVGDRLEIRVAGPNVTPGYHDNPAATAAAFDAEGFYRSGDAVRLIDPDDPAAGLEFDGRLAENFKLITGTWVVVGQVRTALISEAGVLRDAVIAGHDGAYVAALAWIDPQAARGICGTDEDPPLDHPALERHLAECLERLNRGGGSATRIERLLLLAEPPNMDAGEITDKGYINQRAVLQRRAADVRRLLAEDATGVITPAPPRAPALPGRRR
jgi:feruloyl-CoA synthase